MRIFIFVISFDDSYSSNISFSMNACPLAFDVTHLKFKILEGNIPLPGKFMRSAPLRRYMRGGHRIVNQKVTTRQNPNPSLLVGIYIADQQSLLLLG